MGLGVTLVLSINLRVPDVFWFGALYQCVFWFGTQFFFRGWMTFRGKRETCIRPTLSTQIFSTYCFMSSRFLKCLRTESSMSFRSLTPFLVARTWRFLPILHFFLQKGFNIRLMPLQFFYRYVRSHSNCTMYNIKETVAEKFIQLSRTV